MEPRIKDVEGVFETGQCPLKRFEVGAGRKGKPEVVLGNCMLERKSDRGEDGETAVEIGHGVVDQRC